jgi:uncharacterized protein (TIRG00374 family)
MTHVESEREPKPDGRSRSGYVLWFLGAAFSVFLLVWLLGRIRIADLFDTWRRVRWQILLILPVLQVFSFLARAQRLRVLTDRRSPVVAYLSACSVGNLLNMLLPARLGDLSRCLLLRSRTSTPLAGHLACLVLDRVYDLVAFCLLGAGSFAILLPVLSHGFRRLGALGALAAVLAAALGILIVAIRYPTRWLRHIRIRVGRKGWRRTLRTLDSFASSQSREQKWSALGEASFWTVVALAIDLIGVFLVARAVLGKLPLPFLSLLTSAFVLGFAVPGTPGGLGIHQATSVLILGPAGISAPEAIGFSLLSDAFLIAIVAAMGALFLAYEGLSLGDATRLSKTGRGDVTTGVG